MFLFACLFSTSLHLLQ
uniref:Uncharacterized protein n=1 Tax=Anguilla anguilla TaxID=7936 RepID=A0A0E9XW41_ANGAN